MGAYREPGLSLGWYRRRGGRCLFFLPGLARERGEQHTLVALLAPPGKGEQHSLVAAAQLRGKK